MSAAPATAEGARVWLTPALSLPSACLQWRSLRAQGAGGQHVNTTDSAVQLRFDVAASELPEDAQQRLLASRDRRLSAHGVVVIRAQQFRSQALNRSAALARLAQLVERALHPPPPRLATRMPAAARRRRTDDKTRRGDTKRLRRSPDGTE